MRRHAGWAVVSVLVAALACIEDSDPLELHPDVVWLEILLVAGESEARMLAVHPHREREDATPEVDARLRGPGWEAAFSETLELESCTGATVDAARCLRAALPEPVRAGATYGLSGTAPLGSFTGEMRVPDPPLLLTDTLRHSWPEEGRELTIPLRYRAGPDIGHLSVDARDIFETQEDGTEVELDSDYLRSDPGGLYPDSTAGTVWIWVREKPLRFSLTLLGVGWNWTNVLRVKDPVLRPWPSFGIEGNGVYGYFDGVTRSRAAPVFVR